MSKLCNILTMLNLLLSNQKIKISEIASIIGVKERMVRSYKEDLVQAGFNIVSQPGKDGGYYLDSDENNEFQRFSDDELEAIQKIIEHHQHLSEFIEYEYEVQNILTKIKGHTFTTNTTEVRTKSFFDYALPNVDFEEESTKLKTIKDAIASKNKMQIEYFSASSGLTERIVHPESIIYRKGFWYTKAYCENRQAILTFKNCRIYSYEILSESFDNFSIHNNDSKFNRHFGISGEEEYEVKLKIEFPMSMYIRERVWSHDQEIIDNRDDYSIIYTATMSGFPEIKRWILGMGSMVEVLSPEELKACVYNELKCSLDNMSQK